jgi:hypothetical protein
MTASKIPAAGRAGTNPLFQPAAPPKAASSVGSAAPFVAKIRVLAGSGAIMLRIQEDVLFFTRCRQPRRSWQGTISGPLREATRLHGRISAPAAASLMKPCKKQHLRAARRNQPCFC